MTTVMPTGSPQWLSMDRLIRSSGSVPRGYELKSVKMSMNGWAATYHERGGVFNFGEDIEYRVLDGCVRRMDTDTVYEVSMEDGEE